MISSEAAEEVVKISLDGTEMVLRLTGAAAKEIAAMLYALASNKAKASTVGKKWLANEVTNGTDVKVFSLRQEDTAKFVKEAKKYGVSYCAIRDKGKNSDGMTDIIVREADAARVNRIVERFSLASAPTVHIENVPEPQMNENQQDQSEADALIQDLHLTQNEPPESGQLEMDIEEELDDIFENPAEARTEDVPSEPFSQTGISPAKTRTEGNERDNPVPLKSNDKSRREEITRPDPDEPAVKPSDQSRSGKAVRAEPTAHSAEKSGEKRSVRERLREIKVRIAQRKGNGVIEKGAKKKQKER